MPPIDDLPLEEQVISFRDIVTLFVGPEKTKYSIHKTLLQDTRFFELAFSGPYKETQTQEIWLQDETPATMTFFAGYLYRKNIPTGNTQQYLNDLYDFYIFAEKIDHRNLMDATMDMMRLTSHTFDKYIDTDLLVKVYNNTFAGSGLRKFVHHLFLYAFYRNRKTAINTERKLFQRKAKKEGLKHQHYTVRWNPIFKLDRDEIKVIQDMCRDMSDLFADLIERLLAQKKYMEDPRQQSPDREWTCFAHCHGEDDICGQRDNEPEETFWEDNTNARGYKRRICHDSESDGEDEALTYRLAMKKRKSAVGDDSVMEMHEEIVEMEKGEDEMMEDENVDGEPMAEEEITDDENVDGWPMAEEDLTEDENVDEEPMEDSEGEYEEDLEASLAAMKKELAADRVGEVEVEEEL
ncbi:hypothetical protein GLAREA_00258 [Glarea lozoyensis ATCC 20868]|uniref:BTB domain-containing protein n=1 Tax=Glarea lozoyensis (strain ATCC 20868 / MF5171) TaxID=1116229 RepID=S3CTU9_GLAL2|nr:uncharacterized protein GLAREA_00258 [Glarea lozoyensis ATCC 20868]EPE29100.1 hypothetical protein GLAREA_00258 [Glarea lozoyensis ATCC 20868]